jgi:hypothetical protein
MAFSSGSLETKEPWTVCDSAEGDGGAAAATETLMAPTQTAAAIPGAWCIDTARIV